MEDYELIIINSHRALAAKQEEIAARFEKYPEIARLLFINPVLAFLDLKIELSDKMSHHVLHTIQHSTATRERRLELEERLQKAAGEPPKPNNAEWASNFLFDSLKLQPLSVGQKQPKYHNERNLAIVARLKKLRTQPGKSKYARRISTGMGFRIGWKNTLRQLDLESPVPKLKPASKKPKTVPFEELYFYKESHPLARDLLELSIIYQRSFPIHTGDSYRKIKSGAKSNPFSSWIKAVRF
ncbi:MAG: hypothetical protein HUU08_15480 [Candidatus Brocadia sp.]|nr:hypothetical protein [Candidatus Brocadia sp.]